ncbi:hypothetical protein [Chondromyces apiculatus]|uniref:Uncharacterized protein n=1 Tax=Chondromyces apiculatus DSM 436 TaxID=1192034 RepID=A0A017TAY2_9BACT|nr:hypothetical protein [Chondromyces apiculatus]EYF06404.1 Hypothetical protein CAP_1934 [Chondromyces apiculatus DSM 436]
MHALHVSCPHCGAPLPLQPTQRITICAYCNTSTRIGTWSDTRPQVPTTHHPPAHSPTAQHLPTLTPDSVPAEVVEQIKQRVIDGRHQDAVALYAQHARVAPAEAEAAIQQLLTPQLHRLTSRLPFTPIAFAICVAIFCAMTAAALWSGLMVHAGAHLWLLLTVPSAILALSLLVSLPPRAVSMWVSAWGKEGRARILKVVILRQGYVAGGSLVLILMDVVPLAGGESCRDEEVMLVRDGSLPKLSTGNIIRVRYDDRTIRRVFTTTPIEVVGRA